MIEGVDYSMARPGGAALAAAGKQFAVRYLAYTGAIGGSEHKFLTAPEITDLHDHGIAVVANFESTANRALGGWGDGVADGSDALAAMGALRFPIECPVYFSVDFNPTASQLAAIAAYFKGTASVLGLARNGAYGGGNLLRYLAAKGLISWFWNSASTAWGSRYKGAHLWQYQTAGMGAPPINGGSVDLDRALLPNYGQWSAPGGGGPVQPGGPMYNFSLRPGPGGSLVVKSDPAIRYLNLADGTLHAAAGMVKAIAWPITIKPPLGGGAPGADRSSGYLIGDDAAFVLASDVTFVPHPAPADCTAAVKAATDPLKAKIAAAQEALK